MDPRNGRYLKIAHRGASGYAPENTLTAYGLAFDLGADMVEVDVHLTSDGCPVLTHDADLSATIPGAGQVGTHTLCGLGRLAGAAGVNLPTLEDAIDLARGRGGLYVELKAENSGGPVAELITSNASVDTCIIASFDPHKVKRLQHLLPDVRCALLIAQGVDDWAERCTDAGVDYVHFCWEALPSPHLRLDHDLFDRARAHGLKVIVWHEERPEIIREIDSLPVAGICSNCPDLL